MIDKQYLIDFTEEVKQRFNNKEIKAPIHLYDGNEEQVLAIADYFKFQPEDYIFCSWRSNFWALLKGVPRQEVIDEILAGHSISLCFPEYNFYSSAIVGGQLPIAVGVANELKRKGLPGCVFCVVGDMTAETGIFHESWKYSVGEDLPIVFIIEDNEKSVCTPTKETWKFSWLKMLSELIPSYIDDEVWVSKKHKLCYYTYQPTLPHSGSNTRVQF